MLSSSGHMVFFLIFIKIVVGIVLVPLQFLVHYTWPVLEREDVETWKRVVLGMVILPIAGLLWLTVPWWEKLYEF